MPTLSYRIQDFKRPPIFYVARSRYGAVSSQGNTSGGVIPLISPPRTTVSRYSRGKVESIDINIDDMANTAVVRFPKDLHDVSTGNIVGDEVRIRLAQFEGLPSEVVFRGIAISPSLGISSSKDGIAYDCVGYRFVLNGSVMYGRFELDKTNAVVRKDFKPTIFNQDSLPNRSSDRKQIPGLGTTTHVFDQGGKNAKLWTVGDILEYIFAAEAFRKVPGAINIPQRNRLPTNDKLNPSV